jgi:hypothetical protein
MLSDTSVEKVVVCEADRLDISTRTPWSGLTAGGPR